MKLKLRTVTLVGLALGSLAAFAQTNSPGVAASTDAAQPANPPATLQVAEATTSPAMAAPGQPETVIDKISLDELPLTAAIDSLARQAGLNYLLDPKVTFGQVGADGHPGPQPIVSIRWEHVTAHQALEALLNNYGLQVVQDPKSGIARITVKDPAMADPLVTKVIQLKFADPLALIPAIQSTFTDKDHRSKVMADKSTSQLVVIATEKEMPPVEQLVLRLDRQPRQVLIEARLLETQMNPRTQKGIDWSGTLGWNDSSGTPNQQVTFGNNVSGNNIVTPPNFIMSPSAGSFFHPAATFLNAAGVNAAISFLNTYGDTKVISSPRTVTLDNELSTIEVGTMFPIVNITAGTQVAAGGSQTTYSNLTVRLDVTPRISANDFVNLKVNPRILRLGKAVSSTVGNLSSSVNEFEMRSMNTSVLIPSGNTLVMGGLIGDEVDQTSRKVPGLGDIPVLGYLFRWDDKNRNKQALTVFITPTIIKDQDFQPTKADFLKAPVPVSDSVDGDWSSWDSGKAKDWGKAKPAPAGVNANASSAPSTSHDAAPAPATASTAGQLSSAPGGSDQFSDLPLGSTK